MEKNKRVNRKNLKNRLSCIMMIYMDGLPEGKKKKFSKYADATINSLVDYYFDLLRKKDRKTLAIPEITKEMLDQCAALEKSTGKTAAKPVNGLPV